jgi:hypothetical protein
MRAVRWSVGRRKIHVDPPRNIHRKVRVNAALEDILMLHAL